MLLCTPRPSPLHACACVLKSVYLTNPLQGKHANTRTPVFVIISEIDRGSDSSLVGKNTNISCRTRPHIHTGVRKGVTSNHVVAELTILTLDQIKKRSPGPPIQRPSLRPEFNKDRFARPVDPAAKSWARIQSTERYSAVRCKVDQPFHTAAPGIRRRPSAMCGRGALSCDHSAACGGVFM